jgi:ACR3 family arsenite efflux pump ArsB
MSEQQGLGLFERWLSRRWLVARRGEAWFRERLLPFLTPIALAALRVTLALLFSFKGFCIRTQHGFPHDAAPIRPELAS